MKANLKNLLFLSSMVAMLHALCNNDYKSPPRQERELIIKHCLARCFDLAETNKQCIFNSNTGKATGDLCSEDFITVDADRMLGCNFDIGTYQKAGRAYENACDFFIVSGLMKWDKQKKELNENAPHVAETSELRRRAAAARVKLWLQIASDNPDEISSRGLSEATADATVRKRLITSIVEFLQKYKLQGVFVNWKYPGCPGLRCDSSLQKDRASAIAFFKELATALLPFGKVVANIWSATELEIAKFLGCFIYIGRDISKPNSKKFIYAAGPDFQQLINKYVNYTIFEANAQAGLWKNTLDYTRNLQRMENLFNAIFTNLGPGLKKKAILMKELQFNLFTLLSPEKNTIGSKYNTSASDNYLPLKIWCETLRNGTFTRVQNLKNQKYAYSATHWIAYEDYEHAQAEVERLVKRFDMAGFYMDLVSLDDLAGDCGAGRMPYTRMYAEALKGGSCIFKPFL